MNGKHFFLLEVIAVILKYLKEKFLKVEISGGIRGQLEMEDFKWVLTVPAMWKARGKQLMREAAYKVLHVICSLDFKASNTCICTV